MMGGKANDQQETPSKLSFAIDFHVGKGETSKQILSSISGTIRGGHVMALMGPSGAGKTTLINTLTLDAHYGTTNGEVTLNGIPMTQKIFKEKCFVKMGLSGVADRRNSSLSGGQHRRLSIAIAILKKPVALFLDEPTSGLDAAASYSIMNEIIYLSKKEGIISVATIHQPSGKVFKSFDQLMILSKGRMAFAGNVDDAESYFESIGYPCPSNTNPAEHFLDLVNADFYDDETVNRVLDAWCIYSSKGRNFCSRQEMCNIDQNHGNMKHLPFCKGLSILLRRHFLVVIRDPLLYLGRCIFFLLANLIFAFGYWNARKFTQDQVFNKVWVSVWFVGVPSNMATVAVYGLNNEYKSILNEVKNGAISPWVYILAKAIIVAPILFLFAIFSLAVPSYVVQDAPTDSIGVIVALFVCMMLVFESLAECLSVWLDNPISGMLSFMCLYYAFFLHNGIMIPERDLIWPFKWFYHVTPFSYFIRSCMFGQFRVATFDPCLDTDLSVACTPESSGIAVLNELRKVTDIFSTTSKTMMDMSILIAIGAFLKFMYMVGVIRTTTNSMTFTNTRAMKQTEVENAWGTSSSSIGSQEEMHEKNEEMWCRVEL